MPVGQRWTAWCGVFSTRGDQQLNGGCEKVCEWRGMTLSSHVRVVKGFVAETVQFVQDAILDWQPMEGAE
jgi:hypothetical protein